MDAALLKALSGEPTIDPSLRLYIPFNEGNGNVAKDYSNYGNNGTLTDVEWGIGGGGNVGIFNGTSSYVDCGNNASLNITDAITVEAWIYLDSGADTGYVIAKNSNGAGDAQYSLFWDSTDKKITGYLEGGTVGYSVNNSVIEENWYHFAMVYNKTDVRYYVNGQLSGTPFAKTDSITSNNFTINIGRRKPNNFHFNGSIDEVRIYNRTRSALEIKTDFENSRGMYGV